MLKKRLSSATLMTKGGRRERQVTPVDKSSSQSLHNSLSTVASLTAGLRMAHIKAEHVEELREAVQETWVAHQSQTLQRGETIDPEEGQKCAQIVITPPEAPRVVRRKAVPKLLEPKSASTQSGTRLDPSLLSILEEDVPTPKANGTKSVHLSVGALSKQLDNHSLQNNNAIIYVDNRDKPNHQDSVVESFLTSSPSKKQRKYNLHMFRRPTKQGKRSDNLAHLSNEVHKNGSAIYSSSRDTCRTFAEPAVGEFRGRSSQEYSNKRSPDSRSSEEFKNQQGSPQSIEPFSFSSPESMHTASVDSPASSLHSDTPTVSEVKSSRAGSLDICRVLDYQNKQHPIPHRPSRSPRRNHVTGHDHVLTRCKSMDIERESLDELSPGWIDSLDALLVDPAEER